MDIKTFVDKINANPNIALKIVRLDNPLNELEFQFYWSSLGLRSGYNFPSELHAIYDWLTEIDEFTLRGRLDNDYDDEDDYDDEGGENENDDDDFDPHEHYPVDQTDDEDDQF
ncbi:MULTISPECIES: hypothetical protein [unclassified Microcoleus]|uniref:hypothetical protein n=1 Tax=unclassified Microcoleus TaxID=2642155 RepID=UPI002FD46374